MQQARITLDSPLGQITVLAEDGSITRLYWSDEATPGPANSNDPLLGPLLGQAREQLDAYFAGALQTFDLPLAPTGSGFQRRVWEALVAIPYGQTRSYGEIAAATTSVARAVGGACGANPIPIVIPCHRVLASNGKLTGFSAVGGVRDKQLLLDLEAGRPGLPLG